jgi:hypothetical protein
MNNINTFLLRAALFALGWNISNYLLVHDPYQKALEQSVIMGIIYALVLNFIGHKG